MVGAVSQKFLNLEYLDLLKMRFPVLVPVSDKNTNIYLGMVLNKTLINNLYKTANT